MSGYEPKMPCSLTQAKESWEMNTTEKLEQSAIVKEKGTQYFKVVEMSCTLMCIHTSHFNLIVHRFRIGVCFVCAGGEIQAGSYAVQTHCVLVGARVQLAAGGWRESQSVAIGCSSQPSYVLPKAAWAKPCPRELWQGRKRTTFLMLMRGHAYRRIEELQKWIHKVVRFIKC